MRFDTDGEVVCSCGQRARAEFGWNLDGALDERDGERLDVWLWWRCADGHVSASLPVPRRP